MYEKHYAVYILASRRNGTLYIGMTSRLPGRIWEHKSDVVPGFTKRYGVHQLVYFELHDTPYEALKRERRLKEWPRKWKLDLIESINPNWRDLYEEICG
jgi:putative endonuclease